MGEEHFIKRSLIFAIAFLGWVSILLTATGWMNPPDTGGLIIFTGVATIFAVVSDAIIWNRR